MCSIEPACPFGYGLSCTDFRMDTESVQAGEGRVTLKGRVTNTGERFSGREVVQVYYSAPEGRLEKPLQELRAMI